MHLWYCTYLLKKSVYKWTLDSSNLYRSRVICNYFEENKALAPRSPHQRRGVWSGPSGIRSVLEGKSALAVAGGVQNCTFLCVIWARGPFASTALLPALVMLLHPPCSLSTFSLWPEVVIDPSHFSKRDSLDLHCQNWAELLGLQRRP